MFSLFRILDRVVEVKRGQRVALLRDGRFSTLLEPGKHSIYKEDGMIELITLDILGELKPLLPGDPLPLDLSGTKIIEVETHERVAVLVNRLYTQLLSPGRYRYWEEQGRLGLLRFDIRPVPEALPADDPLPLTVAGLYNTTAHGDPVLLQNAGRPIKVLPPGRYRLWTGSPYHLVPIPKTLVPINNDPFAVASDDAEVVSIGVHEAGIVFVNGVLQQGVGSGRYLWWKAAGNLEVVRYDLREEPSALPPDDPLPPAHAMYNVVAAFEGQAVVLCRDGLPQKSLLEGRYRAWNGSRWSLKAVPLSLQSLDVAPQDLLSRDQVPVRVKAAVSVRVVDPLRVLGQPDWTNQIYTAVQLAMREVVTGRELDGLLAERESLGTELRDRAKALLPPLGISLEVVAIKDVILPGEIKELLNRVTLARKEAEALAIKRREETAQTRQLANTARLLENNPVLLRLKELEALGEIASRIDKITLVGSGDMVKSVMLSDLVKAREE